MQAQVPPRRPPSFFLLFPLSSRAVNSHVFAVEWRHFPVQRDKGVNRTRNALFVDRGSISAGATPETTTEWNGIDNNPSREIHSENLFVHAFRGTMVLAGLICDPAGCKTEG